MRFIKSNMETKINIAGILKDKPEGTKLYSPLFGDVYLSHIYNDGLIKVKHHDGLSIFQNNGRYYNYPESEPLLFPSKEMHDWSKFAWKRGDVLVSEDNVYIIFEKFENDDYTRFKGKHYFWKEGNEEDYSKEETKMLTSVFEKASDDKAQTYINTIEERLGGKLNLETLEIEKSEFKDGDVLCVIDNSDDYHYTLIYKGQDNEHIYRYVTMFEDNSLHIRKDAHLTKPKDYSIRYATKEEKQELFDSLAKEGKAWDAEKKQIVNLKPKADKLKPFDKVLVKDEYYGSWEPAFFWKEVDVEDLHPYMIIGGKRYRYCEPYEGNENLLDY